MIPAHSYQETQDKLERVFDRAMIKTLIIAGDLVETSAPCPRTRRDVRRLVSWLNERSVQLIWLRGNHDPATKPALPSSMIVDGWKIAHGDRPIGKSCAIFGHHHPSLRADGLRAPCFLAGPRTIVLPAFSPNAAGLDILSMRLPACFKREPLRCIAGMGEELLDFGCVEDLLRKVGR